jgi:poly-gamma-glutamate synthesis protein (capsule biosynthesis protein)
MSDRNDRVTLFLCGDVMTGRGVDQVLPHPGLPELHESAVRSALRYVELAERAHGPIPRPVDSNYIWGDALKVLDRVRPDLRIINLETSITTSDAYVPKGINYRMHPANVPALSAAGVDCCVLANNHVLDWGEAGLLETLDTLARAGIRVAGVGCDDAAARAPAVLRTPAGARVLVFAFGTSDSGIPARWAARAGRPGVNLLTTLDDVAVARVASDVAADRQPGDLVVASIHWGGNWGYEISAAQRRFAHALIDRAGVDLVHGHSSHHPKAIEVHHDRLILYGCGDFLDDYEGIAGYEEFRDDLVLMYFPSLEAATGRLTRLAMAPMQIHRFRLRTPSPSDRAWLQSTLDRECRRFGHRICAGPHHSLSLAAA